MALKKDIEPPMNKEQLTDWSEGYIRGWLTKEPNSKNWLMLDGWLCGCVEAKEGFTR